MAKILLIEPDSLLANSYKLALETAGHIVKRATGAQDGIYLADEMSPDLVILEMLIAEHNGVEFLYEFRSYPEWQKVPIIIHSLVPPNEFVDIKALWNVLSVSLYHYKPRTSLKQLIESVDELVGVAV
jgi:CheY-like chemotaxis protein